MSQAFKFLRRHPTIFVGGTIVFLLILMAIFAPWIAEKDPMALSPIHRARVPSERFWFGTDLLGRDVFARVVYGARISLIVGISVALLSAVIGTIIGLTSGFVKWIDAIVMRIMDGLMSIPTILLAIALIALTRASLENVIIAITIAEVPRVVRLVRGLALSLREQPYVEAAIAAGASPVRVVFKHIFPNTIAALTVQTTYICGLAILAEASLSFIGAGIPPSIPSWGNIMADGRTLFQILPYIIFFPAVFLSLTVLAVNLMGDGFRDVLDPRKSKTS